MVLPDFPAISRKRPLTAHFEVKGLRGKVGLGGGVFGERKQKAVVGWTRDCRNVMAKGC